MREDATAMDADPGKMTKPSQSENFGIESPLERQKRRANETMAEWVRPLVERLRADPDVRWARKMRNRIRRQRASEKAGE